jgi:hypothetical protein
MMGSIFFSGPWAQDFKEFTPVEIRSSDSNFLKIKGVLALNPNSEGLITTLRTGFKIQMAGIPVHTTDDTFIPLTFNEEQAMFDGKEIPMDGINKVDPLIKVTVFSPNASKSPVYRYQVTLIRALGDSAAGLCREYFNLPMMVQMTKGKIKNFYVEHQCSTGQEVCYLETKNLKLFLDQKVDSKPLDKIVIEFLDGSQKELLFKDCAHVRSLRE